MILPIYTYGQTVLRKEAEEIDKNYPDLDKLISNMFDTSRNADGVGLAAPQVGVPVRLFIIDLDIIADDEHPEFKGYKKVYINPEIVEESEETEVMEEGCLSVPDIREKVERPKTITVNYLNEKFEEIEEELTGFFARVFQHEYDHLDGQLFIDHINVLRKQLIKNKLNGIANKRVYTSYRTK